MTPSDILWLLQYHQNTVTDVATMAGSGNNTATLKNHLVYNAFGTITSQTNSQYQPLQTYTGQIQGSATGLLYYDARWYDPNVAFTFGVFKKFSDDKAKTEIASGMSKADRFISITDTELEELVDAYFFASHYSVETLPPQENCSPVGCNCRNLRQYVYSA
ncbi:MAG: hypothetical protein JNL58_04885 [Planctomyces sp.]|nr:hypothetical protein [Planctomyces sp.]